MITILVAVFMAILPAVSQAGTGGGTAGNVSTIWDVWDFAPGSYVVLEMKSYIPNIPKEQSALMQPVRFKQTLISKTDKKVSVKIEYPAGGPGGMKLPAQVVDLDRNPSQNAVPGVEVKFTKIGKHPCHVGKEKLKCIRYKQEIIAKEKGEATKIVSTVDISKKIPGWIVWSESDLSHGIKSSVTAVEYLAK